MDDYKSEAEQVEEAKPLNGEKLAKTGRKWLDKIEAAKKREKFWRDEADKATLAYTGEESAAGISNRLSFNILHSNVETIVPAVYNSTPIPDIRRRFRDDDPVAKNAARIIERAISVQIDDGALDAEIEGAGQDGYVAGRGIVRVRVEANDVAQSLSYEAVSWRDYVEGPAKRWKEVPWIAFRLTLTKESSDSIANAGYLAAQTELGDYKYEGEQKDDVDVWEVWCKATKCVYFIRASDGVLLKKEQDPLNLTGFFPIPEPAQPITITGRRMPVNPYAIYRELAEELDTLTKRIRGISKGLKVRGATLSGEIAQDVEQWAAAGDNEIVAVRGVEAFAQAGGLDRAITWWPIEQAVKVLVELVQQREQTKQAIYEITGISDIVRGASQSNETATAQQIKTQWGSLRIKKMQRGIERLVRGVFLISAELIATKFTPETLQQITGLEVTPEIAQLLANPLATTYRIDVESDSTIRGDVSRNQGEMNQFMAAIGQYVQAVGEAVIAGQIPKEVAMEILAAFARTFKLGRQAEDALEKWLETARAEAEQPAKPDPAKEAQQAQMQIALEKESAAARKTQAETDKIKLETLLMEMQAMQPPPVEPPAPMPPPEPDPEVELEREVRKARMLKQVDHEYETANRQMDREDKMEEEARAQAAKDKEVEANGLVERVIQEMTQVVGTVQEIGQQLNNVVAMQNAPKRIVRDPKTNKIVGVETVQEAQPQPEGEMT
jgi:hypothetical protein